MLHLYLTFGRETRELCHTFAEILNLFAEMEKSNKEDPNV